MGRRTNIPDIANILFMRLKNEISTLHATQKKCINYDSVFEDSKTTGKKNQYVEVRVIQMY